MRKSKHFSFLYCSFQGIKLMLHSEPRKLLLQCAFSMVHGFSWTLQIVSCQIFFDVIQQAAVGKQEFFGCLVALLWMFLSYLLVQIMNGVDSCHSNILHLAMSSHLNQRLFQTVANLDGIAFEDDASILEMDKAKQGRENLVWVSMTFIDVIFFYGTYFLSMGFYLFSLEPILSVSIIAVFLPSLLSHYLRLKGVRTFEDAAAPVRRECAYYEQCMANNRETRLLGETGFFKNLFINAQKKLNGLQMRMQNKKHLLLFLLDIITSTGYGFILFLTVMLVVNNTLTVGAFAAVISSVNRLFDFMTEVISERIGWATENVATVENYLGFINKSSKVGRGFQRPTDKMITFEHVHFRYPNADTYALSDICLNIPTNQITALVGENGSGKTTLCRLLLGFFAPSDGNIYIDGEKIEDYLHDGDTAVFQDFCQYQMSLKENIHIGRTELDCDEDKILVTCKEVGLAAESRDFKCGLDTLLGREFGGVELSGGQWQRIAIIRGLYRGGSLVVLDEPTSAIDPLEEAKLYCEFLNVCKQKTAVIVTHRLGLAKVADYIVVLDEGRIVETGTHDELMKINGKYKKMFESQQKWYN